MRSAGVAERAAIRLLADVGNDREWWVWSKYAIGHLRVGLTEQEYAAIPHGVAAFDAGSSGPERRRTRRPA